MNTIQCDTWQEFIEIAESDLRDYLNDYPTYWRGQRDPNWPLASRVERIVLEQGGGTDYEIRPVEYRNWRDGFLARFKRAASGLRGPNPKELNTDEWWALADTMG
jgi:hypothetical protein